MKTLQYYIQYNIKKELEQLQYNNKILVGRGKVSRWILDAIMPFKEKLNLSVYEIQFKIVSSEDMAIMYVDTIVPPAYEKEFSEVFPEYII